MAERGHHEDVQSGAEDMLPLRKWNNVLAPIGQIKAIFVRLFLSLFRNWRQLLTVFAIIFVLLLSLTLLSQAVNVSVRITHCENDSEDGKPSEYECRHPQETGMPVIPNYGVSPSAPAFYWGIYDSADTAVASTMLSQYMWFPPWASLLFTKAKGTVLGQVVGQWPLAYLGRSFTAPMGATAPTAQEQNSQRGMEEELYAHFGQEGEGVFGAVWMAQVTSSALDYRIYHNGTLSQASGVAGGYAATNFGAVNVPPLANALHASFYAQRNGSSPLTFDSRSKFFPTTKFYNEWDILVIIGPIYFMLMLGLLFPFFLSLLMAEKERGMLAYSLANGMHMAIYSWIHLLFFILIYALLVCFILGWAWIPILNGWRAFTQNSPLLYVPVMGCYGLMVASISLAASNLFTSQRTASILAYLVVFFSGISAHGVNLLLLETKVVPTALWMSGLIPTVACHRALFILFGSASNEGRGTSLQAAYGTFGPYNFFYIEGVLVMWALIFLGIHMARNEMFPRLHRLVRRVRGTGHQRSATAEELDAMRPEVREEYEATQGETQHVVLKVWSVRKVFRRFDLAFLFAQLRRRRGRRANQEKDAKDAKAEVLPGVRGVTLQCHAGECFGILGQNGAGKTTLMKVMAGMLPADAGTVTIGKVSMDDNVSFLQDTMGICPQEDHLIWPELTVREHLMFFGRLKRLHWKDLRRSVDQTLQAVNLMFVAGRRAGRLSGGMRRRLALGIALVGNPSILLLDEPSTGLDPQSRQDMWQVILKLLNQKHLTLVLTTHSVEEATYLCDRVSMMENGQLISIGKIAQLRQLYANGYHITVRSTSPAGTEDLKATIAASYPALQCESCSPSQIEYFCPLEDVAVPPLVRFLESATLAGSLKDYRIGPASLNSVYLNVLDLSRQAAAKDSGEAVSDTDTARAYDNDKGKAKETETATATEKENQEVDS